MREADWAVLEGAKARLTDEQGEVLASLAQLFIRSGPALPFASPQRFADVIRFAGTEGVKRIVLHKPPASGAPITHVSFEGGSTEG